MTAIESPASTPLPAARPASIFERLRLNLTRNPVVLKELRGRMRGRRAFVVLTLYLLLLSGFALLIYASISAASAFGGGPGPDLNVMGQTIFAGVVAIELFLVCFVTPAFTAAAISGERERQTFDLLRTTLLSARTLVMGKLISALSYVLLLIFAAVPLQSLAFLLGGIGLEEVGISFVLLVVSAIAFAALGIYFSSITRTTLASTVLTYATLLALVIGLPLLALLAISILSAFLSPVFSSSSVTWPLQLALTYAGWFLISIHPAATAIVSQQGLSQQNTALYWTDTIYPSGVTVYYISPWIPYTTLYLLGTVLLILLAVRRVRQIDR